MDDPERIVTRIVVAFIILIGILVLFTWVFALSNQM